MTAIKPDKRLPLFKRLVPENKVNSFEYKAYSPSELTALVSKFAKDKKKSMTSEVAAMIVDIFGSDPFRLEIETEKIVLYSGDKEVVDKKDLAFSAGFSKIETAYDLPDLIINGNLNEALELAVRALRSGISEMQLLFILRNRYTRLNGAINYKDPKQLMSIQRIPYFVARKVFTQSRKIGPQAITNGLSVLFRAEYSLKSARFNTTLVMELLIIYLFYEIYGNKIR
jgi:DNA polymerase-3 subunit delta